MYSIVVSCHRVYDVLVTYDVMPKVNTFSVNTKLCISCCGVRTNTKINYFFNTQEANKFTYDVTMWRLRAKTMLQRNAIIFLCVCCSAKRHCQH
jgi:hypothetical protein